MREVQTCFLARALLISYRNRQLRSPMAEIAERSFYTTDETLQEALRENDSVTGSDPSTEDDLSSDETDSESDSDSCTDETIGEDLDEESLLEKLTDRYYTRTMQSTQERTGMQQREADLLAVRDRFRAGCGCSLDCFADFSVEEVADARLSLKRLSKAECDMLLTGKLQTFYKPPQDGSAPKRARLSYAYDSREVCEGAFCFIHGIGDYTLRALKKHLRDHGLTPRVHGNKGKKPAHAFTRVTILNVLTFIYQYAKVHGLPQPAPPKGRAGQPIQYLPASQNKKIVYKEYERACTPPDFRFSSKFPGDVFVKESGTAKERKITILRPKHPAIRKSSLPPVIAAAGLTQERKQYLFSTIREHIWDPYKDITCPNPDI